MTTENNDELISVREAAKECGRNMETVRRWIWSGKLPARKLGNQLFIKRKDLASYCRLPARVQVAEKAVRAYSAKPTLDEPQTKNKPGARGDLIKKMRKLRQEIRARVGDLDVDKTIEELREERLSELTRLR